MVLVPLNVSLHEPGVEVGVGAPVGQQGLVDDGGFLLYQPLDVRRHQVGYTLHLLGIGLEHLLQLKCREMGSNKLQFAVESDTRPRFSLDYKKMYWHYMS